MDPRKLQGMAVVAMAEAERVGRVSDVMFETAPLRAVGLRVTTDNGDRLIELDRVRSIGTDAITTENLDVVGAASRLERRSLVGLDDLGQLKVVDEKGSFVGRIAGLDIDPDNGDVATMDVRKSELLGLGGHTSTIAASDIVSVGPELITIRSAA